MFGSRLWRNLFQIQSFTVNLSPLDHTATERAGGAAGGGGGEGGVTARRLFS